MVGRAHTCSEAGKSWRSRGDEVKPMRQGHREQWWFEMKSEKLAVARLSRAFRPW